MSFFVESTALVLLGQVAADAPAAAKGVAKTRAWPPWPKEVANMSRKAVHSAPDNSVCRSTSAIFERELWAKPWMLSKEDAPRSIAEDFPSNSPLFKTSTKAFWAPTARATNINNHAEACAIGLSSALSSSKASKCCCTIASTKAFKSRRSLTIQQARANAASVKLLTFPSPIFPAAVDSSSKSPLAARSTKTLDVINISRSSRGACAQFLGTTSAPMAKASAQMAQARRLRAAPAAGGSESPTTRLSLVRWRYTGKMKFCLQHLHGLFFPTTSFWVLSSEILTHKKSRPAFSQFLPHDVPEADDARKTFRQEEAQEVLLKNVLWGQGLYGPRSKKDGKEIQLFWNYHGNLQESLRQVHKVI